MGRCVCVGDCECGLTVGPQPPTYTLTEEQWKTLKNFFKVVNEVIETDWEHPDWEHPVYAVGRLDGSLTVISWIIPELFDENA